MTYSKRVLLLSSFLASGLAVPAFAQASGETGVDAPSDIIVTARRVEERLQDVPISITVFEQEQLDNRNIVSAADLATYTPSLSTNTRFGAEKSSFAIRGFTQEIGTSPSVGVYFADVVAPRAAGQITSGNGAGPGSFFDLQNVQVLKGPQGTLFGRNTTGGAVLLVPKKPTDYLEGFVEGTIGNYDARRVKAVLNVPLADTFRVRLGVDRNKRDGYLINRSGIGPKDFADTNYIAARLSLVADLTPDLENYMIATFSDSDTNGTLPKLASCQRTPIPFGPIAVTGPLACAQFDRQIARGDGFYGVESSISDPQQHLRQWQVINTTTWQASDALTVKNIISYGEFRESTKINAFGDNLLADDRSYSFIVFAPGYSGNSAAQSTFTEELQFQGTAFSNRLNWQAGAYLEISNPLGDNTQATQILSSCTDIAAYLCKPIVAPIPIGGNVLQLSIGSLSLVSQRTSFRNIGIYGQGTYDLTDKLSVTAGLRYTHDRTKGSSKNVSARFLAENYPSLYCTKTPSVTFSSPQALDRSLCFVEFVEKSGKPTWLINIDYKPVEDVLFYAKYARGYRQGGVNTSVTGFETWSPEKVDSYEVGVKSSFSGFVSGTFNIAGFYNDFSDQQIQANLTAVPGSGAPGNAIVNAGSSRMWGVEVESSLRLFEGFRLDAAYGYLNTEVRSLTVPAIDPSFYTSITPTATVGDSLTLAPKHKVTITGTYTLPLDDSIGTVSLGATYSHTGTQIATRAITAVPENQLIPATDLVNLNVNWDSVGGLPVDLAFFATNVTKEKYRTSVSAAFTSAGFDPFIIGEPRIYGVRLRYNFGQ